MTVRREFEGKLVGGQSNVPIVFCSVFAVLLTACAPSAPVAEESVSPSVSPSSAPVYADCCSSPSPSSSATPAQAQVLPSTGGSLSASPAAGRAGLPATSGPNPAAHFDCPPGALTIGISYVRATPPTDQIQAEVTGSVVNLSQEGILVPLPTVYASTGAGLIRTQEWTTSGAFEGAPGATVIDLKPMESRVMKFSITMSRSDFRATAYWSMNFERGEFKYASPESQSRCVVRVNDQSPVIPNPLGPEWFR